MSHAMILAAGRGERMRPLTDNLPKPMLEVGNRPLIEWHIEALKKAGFVDLVINHAWLGDKIEVYLENGQMWGVNLQYSPEATALETAGGIRKALHLLGNEPFAVLNGDVFTDYPRSRMKDIISNWLPGQLAHLVLVPNPPHHPQGDFAVDADGVVRDAGQGERFTFSGIGVYHPALFASLESGHPEKLAPLLRKAMQEHSVRGEVYTGLWEDVGTPDRLAKLNEIVNTL